MINDITTGSEEEGDVTPDVKKCEINDDVHVVVVDDNVLHRGDVKLSATNMISIVDEGSAVLITSCQVDNAEITDCTVRDAGKMEEQSSNNSIFKMKPIIRLRPTWNKRFGSTIKMLRVASQSSPRNISALRAVTSAKVPIWLPTLPSGISIQKSSYPHPPGEWFFPTATGLYLRQNAQTTSMQGKYILYLHGGGFCTCSTGTHRGLLMRLAKHTGGSILSVDYRRPPEHPFPTPVDDCLSAYLYLLEKTGDSSRIVFAGDSAGGNLVLSTLLRIAKHGISPPAGAILLSPWVDLTDNGRLPSWERNCKIDYLPQDMAKLFAVAYMGGNEESIDPWQADPATSPLFSDNLHELPKLLVEFGDCEVLHDQIFQFCRKAEEAGVNIQYNIREDMVHVFPIYSFTGMQQCQDAFESMVQFFEKCLQK